MKKNFYKLLLAIAVLFTVAGQIRAQIATNVTMPQISDGTTNHWYYLECFRDGGVLLYPATRNGVSTFAGANWQQTYAKFRVVKHATDNTYGIVDESGRYLQQPTKANVSGNAEVTFATTNEYKGWTISERTTEGVTALNISTPTSDDAAYTSYLHIRRPAANCIRHYNLPEAANLWAFVPLESVNQPFQVSSADASNENWYTIVNVASGTRSGLCLGTTGNDAEMNASSNLQFWKIVNSGDGNGTYYVVNKNGQYVSSTLSGSNFKSLSVPDASCKWSIKVGVPPGLSQTPPYSPLPISCYFMQGTQIMNLNATSFTVQNNATVEQGSFWKFMTLADMLAEKRTQFDALIASAQKLVSVYPSGSEFAYTTAAKTTLSNAIATAQGVNTNNWSSLEVASADIASLQNAITAFTNSRNSDVTKLLSSTPSTYSWYSIVSTATSAYAKGKAISSNAITVPTKFTYEPEDAASNAQLFRFELNASQTNVLNIINKANGKYMGADGSMLDASTSGNEFAITPLSDGISYLIDPTQTNVAPIHAQEINSVIVNWDSGVGSASAWVIKYVKDELVTSIKTAECKQYKIRSNNGIITVDGVKEFDVYSAVGLKMDAKTTLKNGIYFVKIKNDVQKVVVK